jgi:hypothetical protein
VWQALSWHVLAVWVLPLQAVDIAIAAFTATIAQVAVSPMTSVVVAPIAMTPIAPMATTDIMAGAVITAIMAAVIV